MARNDYELNRLGSEIEMAKQAVANAIARVQNIKSKREVYKREIASQKYNMDDLRRSIDREYEAARYCYQAKDHISAANHKYNAQSYKNSLQRERDILNGYFERLNSYKSDLDAAYASLNEAKAWKKRASDAFQARLTQLKAENAAKQAKWHEKPCKRCGRTIRYHEDWVHIPNYCKECKATWQK